MEYLMTIEAQGAMYVFFALLSMAILAFGAGVAVGRVLEGKESCTQINKRNSKQLNQEIRLALPKHINTYGDCDAKSFIRARTSGHALQCTEQPGNRSQDS